MGALTERFLDWEGCVNVRDLGGLPLREGGLTRSGAVVRADNVRHLTPRGWDRLRAHGVRTIIDLRFAIERKHEPEAEGVDVVAISLFGEHDPLEAARVDELIGSAQDEIAAVTRFYIDTLETCGPQIASAVEAVASAKAGGVAVHCFVGKDRTGLVVAFLLELAGVRRDAVIADYALTEGRVESLVRGWIDEGRTSAERTLRERVSAAPAAAMEATLNELDERWGGAAAFLTAHGVDQAALDRVRSLL